MNEQNTRKLNDESLKNVTGGADSHYTYDTPDISYDIPDMETTVLCHFCGANLNVYKNEIAAAESAGQDIICPNCKNVLRVAK